MRDIKTSGVNREREDERLLSLTVQFTQIRQNFCGCHSNNTPVSQLLLDGVCVGGFCPSWYCVTVT